MSQHHPLNKYDEFDAMLDEIVNSSVITGSTRFCQTLARDGRRRKARKIVAASMLVANREGVAWCREHPEEALEAVSDLLTARNIVSILFALLGFSNPWVTLATVLLPAVLDWLFSRENAGVCGLTPNLLRQCESELA